MTLLSVLMPVYNESRTLRTIVAKVLASPVDTEIELVCVDDCSSDDSLSILKELAEADSRIRVIAQPVNMGKGKAIRTAIDHMTGDIGIIQDADLEYDPNEYPTAARSRFSTGGPMWSTAPASPRRAATGALLLALVGQQAAHPDVEHGQRPQPHRHGDLLQGGPGRRPQEGLRLTSDRFGLEPEITARLAQWGARIYEVPISYHGRTYAEGKNIGWRDGVEALWLIFKFRFLDTRATDEDSVVTRQSLGRAPRFRRWILSWFGDYLGHTVLEVNAGPGHTTSHLLDAQR
jgi:glycosyltransferase involved in cell wall biosynthesis